jgi:hypothetical protein
MPGPTEIPVSPIAVPTGTMTENTVVSPTPPPAAPVIDTGKQLLACTSPLSESLANEKGVPSLQNYKFSAPQVVLTNNFSLRIMGWISEDDALILKDLKPGGAKVAIEIFNVKSGQSIRLAEENTISGNLLWLPDKKAVAYIAYDLYTDPAKNRSRLMVAALGSGTTQLTAEGVTQPLFAMPDEGVVVLGSDGQKLTKVDSAKGTSTLSSIAEFTMRGPQLLHVAQHPNFPMIALYNNMSFVIMDLKTGKTKELNLGKLQEEKLWALEARWNPDGKHLAVIATAGGLSSQYTTLMILDIEKECLWEIPVSRPFYIDKMAWSPAGQFLMLSGFIGTTNEGYSFVEYRLFDPTTGQERKVNLSDYYKSAVYFDWSPDGKTIIFYCPTPERGALCTMVVEVEQ